MNKILVALVFLFSFSASQAQEVIYDNNAEVRNVGDFTGIEVSGTVILYLSQGTETGVAISAGDEKYNNKIMTEVKDGVLKITVDGGIWNSFSLSNRKLKAYVSVKNLSRIGVSGASTAIVNGTLRADALNVDVSGASEIKGNIAVNKLNMDVSGASVARLSGTATDALIDASGACKINSYDLKIEKCKANSSGASNIRITVTKELSADASGGATVFYRGEGVQGTINASAGASIKKRSSGEDK